MAIQKLYHPVIFVGDEIEQVISKMGFRIECTMLRTQHHMTKKEMAKLTGLSQSCIADIEGLGNPKLSSLIKYLDCFGYELAIREKL